MPPTNDLRVAILYPGDREARRQGAPNPRFVKVFEAFQALGVPAAPAVYHDDFCAEEKQQISKVDAVLVLVIPIEGGNDRTKLDRMLREVASCGVFVSTHPDII